MSEKWLFGIVSIIVLGVIQIAAFMLGIDGQLMIITTNAIVGIITFLLGMDVTKTKVLNEIIPLTNPEKIKGQTQGENLSKPKH